MTEVMNQMHSEELLKRKQEIINDTIRNLLVENDGTFDLRTHQGINAAVDYMVDYLVINKIKVNEIALKNELIRHLPATKEKQ